MSDNGEISEISESSEIVRLRGVQGSDLELFHAYEQDAEAVRRSRFPAREREAFMDHWEKRVIGNPTGLVRTVTVDGATAGNVVAWWAEDGRRFVGYWLGRRYWGRGIGTRALTLFLQEEQNRPLYADPFHGNTASVRLLEHHGFRRTTTVRYGEDDHILLVLEE
ncbi:GNAT family N-acetyltransferase [Streptomyces bluensis]|uniref:GNAT family N-acetyltransferase n=1 Tax=Streptomyces bluensis TaxID=33897 RepID=A0ABW6ULZ9_9ACTN